MAHDNVSANMAALTFRANIDTMEVQNLEQLFSLGSSEQQRRFWNVMQAQTVMRSNFGMQLVNKGDQITNTQYTFTGLSGETGMFGSISDKDIEAGKGRTIQDLTALHDPVAGLSFGEEEASPFEGAVQDAALTADYSPNQPRDKYGRWTNGGLQSGSGNGTMGLTEAEEYAVSKYIGKDSYLINEKLRSGEPLTQEDQRFVEDLDSALEKMPVYQGTVYRSVSNVGIEDVQAFIQDYSVGKHKWFPSYLSSGVFVYDESFPIQYVIQSHTGRDIRSFNLEEGEILFSRESGFFITKVEGYTIFMEEASSDE